MRPILLSLAFGIVTASVCLAKSYGNFETVVFHTCYDGDTCTFSIPGVHPLLGDKISIRLAGIDTPEIKGKCESEKQLALEAKSFLNDRLKRARKIRLLNVQRGKYFRIVAEIEADGVVLNRELVSRGLAYPYYAGKKKGWCGK